MLNNFICRIWVFHRATMISIGIDQNPGPKPKSSQSLSICEWKLNNISALTFPKISLLSS